MLQMLVNQYKRFSYALQGIIFGLTSDRSYRSQFFGGSVVLIVFYFLFAPFTETEILFLILGWVLILITELQNSSIEDALDHLHPEMHENIKRSKDKAAGAVLTAGFFLLFVMIVIVWNHYTY